MNFKKNFSSGFLTKHGNYWGFAWIVKKMLNSFMIAS